MKSFDMPIKVKKRESTVAYMLYIPESLSELGSLREQVGEDKVSKLHNFGVGYI